MVWSALCTQIETLFYLVFHYIFQLKILITEQILGPDIFANKNVQVILYIFQIKKYVIKINI